MTKNRVQWVAFLGMGLAAGIGFWFLVTFTLAAAGFYFYALHIASYVAVALWLIASPVIYINTNKSHPHAAAYRIAPLLIGMGLMVSYFAVAWTFAHG
ncbi:MULTISPECIES: hypothetical protein [Mycobacterium]|uniref:Uncharacterized protein n=1 Tax=Mycobacterium paraffinicum TaxID=53378 RepID=A0A1Q4HP68_9MYCO|nr:MULTISPECIES: hypothetical protein [Mycobacterium]OCB11771.1 hypothetical protein A5689_04600 [Mycobacterium intracellulare subsp. yongonense]OJZ69475.1 hypothetical protein BRW65_23010 [Mycobacterium paraffinicum]